MGFHVHTNPQGASCCLLRPIWEPRDWSGSASPRCREKLHLWITVKQHSHDWWVYPHHHICLKDPFCPLWRRCELTTLTMAGCISPDRSKVPEFLGAFISCSPATGKWGRGAIEQPGFWGAPEHQPPLHQASQLTPGEVSEEALPLVSLASDTTPTYPYIPGAIRCNYFISCLLNPKCSQQLIFFFSFFPMKSKRKPELCVQEKIQRLHTICDGISPQGSVKVIRVAKRMGENNHTWAQIMTSF